MDAPKIKNADVAVIGGGPAGISACLELAGEPGIKTVLFESETDLGGMPRGCHVFFGMRDMKRIHSGPVYARKLVRLINKTEVDIHTDATVTKIAPAINGSKHVLKVVTKEGLILCECKYIILATGCFERSREARRIPGTRPAGVFTTGSLQQIVNLQKVKPGNKALIVGSEHVAFSAALTLNRAGTKIVGMVSEDGVPHTYPLVAKAISAAFGFSIFTGATIEAVHGRKRVEGVKLVWEETKRRLEIECDTIVCTGNFRPDAALIHKSEIKEDPSSMGPAIDMNLMTSVKGIFAAGNVLRGADMHDVCALEGRTAAGNILKNAAMRDEPTRTSIIIRGMAPIRHVVPQTLFAEQIKNWKTSFWTSGVSLQVGRTLKKAAIEAWSGDRRIWSRQYKRLLANSRIPLPVENFDWSQVDFSKEIALKAVY